MKKGIKTRKLSRTADQRQALLRGLARALFLEERITITLGKAKELRPWAEKMITRAKKGDLNARRRLARHFDEETVKKLVDSLGKRYQDRSGGYTRIIKAGYRDSDAAAMAVIELV